MGLLVGLVAEVLQLYVEVVGTEDVAEAEEGGLGLAVAAGVDEVADLAVAAAGEADEPVGMGAERLEGDEGRPLALGVGEVGGGEEAAEVGVALAGLGEKHEVVRIVGGAGAGVGLARVAAGQLAAVGRFVAGQQRLHPHLGAEDRLDVSLGAGLGEADGAVETVVVGEGQGRLPELGRPGDQLLDAAAAVEEREVRVDMEVDERSSGGGL